MVSCVRVSSEFVLLGLALGEMKCLGGQIYMRAALMKEKMFKAVKSKE